MCLPCNLVVNPFRLKLTFTQPVILAPQLSPLFFRHLTPGCGVLLCSRISAPMHCLLLHDQKTLFHWEILSSGLCIPSKSPNNSYMNVTIISFAGAATVAIIPIPIVAMSFTRIPTDSLCIIISGLAQTTCVRLFRRLYSSHGFKTRM